VALPLGMVAGASPAVAAHRSDASDPKLIALFGSPPVEAKGEAEKLLIETVPSADDGDF
jgi:hypothetical protein